MKIKIHKATKAVLVSGIITVTSAVLVSTFLYFGAEMFFDYAACITWCERLLAYSRPTAVFFCAASLAVEYIERQKAKDK